MDKPKTTPKDFFLWAGAMLSLYVSVFSFLGLIFDYINYTFPDPLTYFPADPYSGSISYEMASLIVLLPLFLVLMYFIDREIKRDPTRREVWVRRWALVLTIFVAGATVAIDLIVLLMNFLNGGLTLPFVLKIVMVFLVAAGGLMHFTADLRDYWQTNPQLLHRVGWGVGVLAVLTIFSGFLIIGTPWQARLYEFDAQKISDLQEIQSQVLSYWQQNQKLPPTLNDLNDSLSGYSIPTDPQSGLPYTYQVLGTLSFNLCATFNTDSNGLSITNGSAPMIPAAAGDVVNNNWQHGSGNTCFLRSIDPALYPPLTK
jgi:hypothetical protein